MRRKSAPRPEELTLRGIVREYKNRGYKVIVQPSPSQLPEFLAGHRPDIIAASDAETVVIEIKARRTLQGDASVSRLAELLGDRPNWRFELVVADHDGEDAYGEYPPIDEQRIGALVDVARMLRGEGDYAAALMMLWVATEGALRLVGEREGLRLQGQDTGAVIKELAMLGYLDGEHYQVLRDSMMLRNALVHGLNAGQVDNGAVAALDSVFRAVWRS
jgi:hypothetical protein